MIVGLSAFVNELRSNGEFSLRYDVKPCVVVWLPWLATGVVG